MIGSEASADGPGLRDMIHRLPRARAVDRIGWLAEQCRDRRVVHVGFADSAFADRKRQAGLWLHGHLADTASELVGIDIDAAGVAAAASASYEVHAVDCTDPGAVAALGLEPADVVVAGEVIEHVDRPGPFLDGLRVLCRPSGRLIITTPNAYGLINVAASILKGVECNHPDHVTAFTWRTLTELARRHGWRVVETVTYVPVLGDQGERTVLEAVMIQTVLGVERILSRLGRPFAANGLIVAAEPA